MRITRTGLAVVAAAVGLVAAARMFGLVELFVMAIAVAALVVVTALWVRFRPVDVAIERSIRGRRVHAGDPSTVEVSVHNRTRTSPVLHLHDPITGTRGADLMVAPQHPRATTKASYRLPTTRRGIVTVGPMTVTITDPFGLWRMTTPLSDREDVTVLPTVDDIVAMSRTLGPDPDAGTHRGAMGRRGDEFAALRAYVVGDDLRRVHWPSSARADDDLMVREEDVPWHGRIVVVLDLRRHVYDVDTLERAVSAAASVIQAHVRRGDHVRLLTTEGFDSHYASGAAHLGRTLDHLAIAERGNVGGLRATVVAACHGGSGALIVVSGRPSTEDIAAVDEAVAVPSRRVICFADDQLSVTARGTGVVSIGPNMAFRTAWLDSESAGVRRRRAAARLR